MHEDEKMPEQFDDAWLTRALQARVDAEPRPGLEERILARLTTVGKVQDQTLSWKWLAVPAAATLLIVLAGHELFRTKPSSPASETVQSRNTVLPQQGNDLARGRLRSDAPLATAKRAIHPYKSVRSVAAGRSSLPKLEHFPSDAAASKQEQVLENLASRRPQLGLVQYARTLSPLNDLEIEENFIPPLSIQDVEPQTIPNEQSHGENR